MQIVGKSACIIRVVQTINMKESKNGNLNYWYVGKNLRLFAKTFYYLVYQAKNHVFVIVSNKNIFHR